MPVTKAAKKEYFSCFNPQTGFYLRTGDPFFSPNGPEMLDIGITSVCNRQCPYCYTDSGPDGSHMPLQRYRSALEIFKRVYQVALGGGEPTLHPDFPEMLRLTRECYGIVPNYSTNGDHLSEEVIAATNLWCGAVAVTCHDGFHDMEKLEAFDGKRVVRVAHLLLSNRTLEPIIEFLGRKSFPPYLDGIIVLLYKPCGRAGPSDILNWSPRVAHLAQLMVLPHSVKIGFDSCLAPLFAGTRLLPAETYDSCEAGRFSLYIDWSGRASPCSFLRESRWRRNLEDVDARQIWNSAPFVRIRRILLDQCPDCHLRQICFGGCPAYRETNLCPLRKMNLIAE